jgi:hypothetical protein
LNKKVGKKLMEYVGAASGAALGFIHGNVPGAYIGGKVGYKLGKKYSDKMSSSTKRSKSSAGPSKRSKSSAGGSRRMSSSSNMSFASSRRSSLLSSTGTVRQRIMAQGNHNSGIKVASVSSKGGKRVRKEGLKKKVKVPRLLRKQVKEILTPSEDCGTFLETTKEMFFLVDPAGQNLRTLGPLSNNIKQLFDPVYIQHVASVLFHGKAGKQNPQLADSGNFNEKTLSVKVLTQNCTYRLKNNSARTMYINFYIWSPKHKLPVGQDDPATNWIDTMANEAGTLEFSKRNINNANPSTLYATPYMSKTFMNTYAIDCERIVLEPGKEWSTVVKGPNNKVYDFSKYWDPVSGAGGGQFQNQQKFIKGVFITCYYDLAATLPGIATRRTNMQTGQPFGLVAEYTVYTKIESPPLTGFKNASTFVAGDNIPLSNKKVNPYYLNDWSSLGDIGLTKLFNDNVPNVPASEGV